LVTEARGYGKSWTGGSDAQFAMSNLFRHIDRCGSGRKLVSHLNRIFGEINAALIAIAIGLAVLDYICWLQWEVSAALGR
jgi:hypothetical protein